MAGFLLDTNVLAELTRASPNVGVLRGVERYLGGLVTASVVVHESRYGIERMPRSRRRDELEWGFSEALKDIAVLPYDERAADWHARERARLRASGITIPFADAQIAATAAVNDATLVTNNVVDFKAFRDLTIVNWMR